MSNFGGFPFPSPSPNNSPNQCLHPELATSSEVMMRNASLRHLEKELIREEIVAEEIARRRELELEVRREMAMERELAIRRVEGIDLSGSSSFGGRSLGSLPGRSDVGYFEPLPFQRNPVGNTTPQPQVGKVVFLAKPVSSKVPLINKKLPAAGASKLNIGGPKKNPLDQLGCALCKVSFPCKQALNDHLQEKRHQEMAAKLKANRAANKRTGSSKLVEKKGDGAFKYTKNTGNPKSNHQKKQWTCALCQVTATREEDLNNHFQGKNHRAKEAEQSANKTLASHAKWQNTDKLEEKPITKDVNRKQFGFCGEDGHVPSNSEIDMASNQNHKAKEAELMTSKSTGKHSGGCTIWQKNSDKQQEKPMTDNVDKKHSDILVEDRHLCFSCVSDVTSDLDFKAKEAERTPQRKTTDDREGSAIRRRKRGNVKEEKPITENVNSKQSYFWCEYCHVRCSSDTNLASHLKGKKHMAQLEAQKKIFATVASGVKEEKPITENVNSKQSYFWCEYCHVRCSSDTNLASHLKGKKHMAQLEAQKKIFATVASGVKEEKPITENVNSKQSYFWCECCHVRCSSDTSLASHLKGKKHMAQLEAQKKIFATVASLVNGIASVVGINSENP